MINKEKDKEKKPTDTTTVKVVEQLQIVDKESGEKLISKRG